MAWDYDGTRRHEHPKTKDGVCFWKEEDLEKGAKGDCHGQTNGELNFLYKIENEIELT